MNLMILLSLLLLSAGFVPVWAADDLDLGFGVGQAGAGGLPEGWADRYRHLEDGRRDEFDHLQRQIHRLALRRRHAEDEHERLRDTREIEDIRREEAKLLGVSPK